MNSSTNRILIVDDHPLVRQGLVELVRRQPGMDVCGEAGSAREALDTTSECVPDLAIVDLALGDADGLDLVRDLRARSKALRILVVSRHAETIYAERALRAGANGYVMKHEGLDTVVEALHRVLAGEVFLSEVMQAHVVSRLVGRRDSHEGEPVATLSDREFQVFVMIGRGLGPSEIAERLGLSVKTIDAHRARIKGKLNLESAARLRQCAIEWCRRESET